jgi:hypothetical protein
LVKEVGAERALLGNIFLLVPEDDAMRARGEDPPLSNRFFGIDDHNAIGPLIDRLVGRSLGARGIITMHTGFRDERDLDFWIFSPFPFDDLHPEMVLERLSQGNRWKVVSVVFIPTGQKTVVAPRALV